MGPLHNTVTCYEKHFAGWQTKQWVRNGAFKRNDFSLLNDVSFSLLLLPFFFFCYSSRCFLYHHARAKQPPNRSSKSLNFTKNLLALTLSLLNVAWKYKILSQSNWHKFWHQDVAWQLLTSFIQKFLSLEPSHFLFQFQKNYSRKAESWKEFFNIWKIRWDMKFGIWINSFHKNRSSCKISLNLSI